MATHSSILAWRIPGMGEPGHPDLGHWSNEIQVLAWAIPSLGHDCACVELSTKDTGLN